MLLMGGVYTTKAITGIDKKDQTFLRMFDLF